jgi:hypothetical protein
MEGGNTGKVHLILLHMNTGQVMIDTTCCPEHAKLFAERIGMRTMGDPTLPQLVRSYYMAWTPPHLKYHKSHNLN